MFSFNGFLTEAKNLHLEHLEDEVLNNGVVGTRGAINFLQSLRDMLAGNSKSSVNVTVKWDGAPAIFAGINPENGQFFVGTKGVFNKNAKINYTIDDIDRNHPGTGLNQKLKVALTELSKLGIKDVDKIYNLDDMVGGDALFAATGVTNGSILSGIKIDEGIWTNTLVMRSSSKTVRWITAHHQNIDKFNSTE